LCLSESCLLWRTLSTYLVVQAFNLGAVVCGLGTGRGVKLPLTLLLLLCRAVGLFARTVCLLVEKGVALGLHLDLLVLQGRQDAAAATGEERLVLLETGDEGRSTSRGGD
jgi:hypothetical protein